MTTLFILAALGQWKWSDLSRAPERPRTVTRPTYVVPLPLPALDPVFVPSAEPVVVPAPVVAPAVTATTPPAPPAMSAALPAPAPYAWHLTATRGWVWGTRSGATIFPAPGFAVAPNVVRGPAVYSTCPGGRCPR